MSGPTSILLIEHDARARSTLLRLLVREGYLVAIVSDWQTGVARANEEFDVIVASFPSDLTGPGTRHVIEHLRTVRQTPVLILASTNECRQLRAKIPSSGIRLVPRINCLEELRRMEASPSSVVSTARRQSTLTRTGVVRSPAAASPQRSSTHPAAPNAQRDETDTVALDALSQLRDDTLPAGTVIDKYRIEEHVGSGAFAHVYRATHLVLSMPCALKVLKASLAILHTDMVDSFCTEARNAIRINHPNVVRVHDVTRGKAHVFLVMEWIDGLTLGDLLTATGPLALVDVVRIGLAVASGLEAANALGMIHRDVKPANILLANDGGVKLVDFGIAKDLAPNSGAHPIISVDESSKVVGTPLYMSPEQAFDPEHVDRRSDIYSLGATLFHAAAGTPPFSGGGALQILLKHRDDPLPNPMDHIRDCPFEFAQLISGMLAKNPFDRPASYTEVRIGLQAVMDQFMTDGSVESNGWSNVYVRKQRSSSTAS